MIGYPQLTYSQTVVNKAEKKPEIGIELGSAFFLGDLGGNKGIGTYFIKDLNMTQTTFYKGLHFTFFPAYWLGIRTTLCQSKLRGDDAAITPTGGAEIDRRNRNLKFRSILVESSVSAEIYPGSLFSRTNTGRLKYYLLSGFSLFYFNPQGEYYRPDGTTSWEYLKPLRLEGQGTLEYPDRKNYKLIQPALIAGGGIKYYFSANKYLSIEIKYRKSFTDYLDDVSTSYIDPQLFNNYLDPSMLPIARQLNYREPLYNNAANATNIGGQRGDPTDNDSFFSTAVHFGFVFDRQSRRKYKSQKCPRYY
ncbi:MAG: hypothetical protein NTW29_10630 [Bacteroidetes bacterium]|nr:hypothetical protein [Bacteroidota bacterium]